MKGVVFTEFMEMVEATFGDEILDTIVENANLPHGGAYTSIGTYPHAEMVTLVVNLSKETAIPVPDLIHAFGKYLFGRFAQAYRVFFENAPSAFEFLESIEQYIHVEVRKLYPDAELPTFECRRLSPTQLEMLYQSDRSMSDLATGLIEGCGLYYNTPIHIAREYLNDQGSLVKFTLTLV